MTEEEIKKFAKEYVQNNTDESVNSFIGEQLQKAFIEGTDFMYYSNNEELKKKLTEKDKQIAELEKENAELKEQIGDVIECFTSSSIGDDFEMAESAREVMEVLNMQCYRHGKVKSKLTEAKEIIRALLFHLNKDTFAVIYETKKESIEKAEDFLKENNYGF